MTPTDLFGQQLSAQTVEGDELPGQQTGVKEALGHQHDFANQLEVRHHHSAWSETQFGVECMGTIIRKKSHEMNGGGCGWGLGGGGGGGTTT